MFVCVCVLPSLANKHISTHKYDSCNNNCIIIVTLQHSVNSKKNQKVTNYHFSYTL